jgi:uncharacterized protein
LDPAVVLVMFFLGMLLGFVGLGGAGLVAALLIGVFGVPVHLGFATALGAMFAASATGGWSHLREGNVDPVLGIQIGVVGMAGAYLGGGLALSTGATELKTFAGLALMLNSVVLYLRTRVASQWVRDSKSLTLAQRWWKELPGSAFLGLICGTITGFLSIGAAPWIQVGLMMLKGTSLRVTIGTTMVAVALMSITGAVRFAIAGQFDAWLLASVILGLSFGTFVGAKLTRRAPRRLVRAALIVTPLMAGTLLVFGPGGG